MKNCIFIILLIITGCQRANNSIDQSKVNIEINSPLEGQTFVNGDSVLMNAKVTYANQLHGCEVKIIDTTTGYILYDKAEHTHSDRFNIKEKWINELSEKTSLKVELVVYLDHTGNSMNKVLYINTK